MKLYKLTDQNNKTHGGMEWGESVTHELPICENPELCTSTVLHAYKNPNLALLLNPIHACIDNPILWEAEGNPCVEDWGKCGCFKLITTHKIELPQWYQNHREDVQVNFAILCAESVLHCYESKYPEDDRPRKAIEAARNYLENKNAAAAAARAADAARAAAAARAAHADARAARVAAARAAHADARAARVAADAADARAARAAAYAADAAAARAADAAAYADADADAAADAARAAAAAAYDAAAADEIDFCELADKAVKMIEEGE